MIIRLALVLALASATGCLRNITVDSKTAFERQVIGNYEDLEAEVLMLASARAQEASAARPAAAPADGDETEQWRVRQKSPEGAALYGRAVQARRVELFLRDDLDELLRAGCVGEGTDGALAVRECGKAADPGIAERRARLVDELNAARVAVVDYIMFANPDLTSADRAQVVATLHRLKVQGLEQGAQVQGADGSWSPK